MNEHKQARGVGQGQARVSFLMATGTIDLPTSSIEQLVAIQIKKRIQIPVAATTAVLCAVLSVSAVVVGIIVLVIPFAIGCAFSVYAVYNLRQSTLEEPEIANYAVMGKPESQSELPPTPSEVLSENVVDAKQGNTHEETQEKRTFER
jgi:hypothetical protein